MDILGIDIGKHRISVCLLRAAHNPSYEFDNNQAGFELFQTWLRRYRSKRAAGLHACMEATGNYGLDLAVYLVEQGHTVSIVNPLQIKAFGQAELARNKTDKLDAALIARFCRAQSPGPWTPPARHIVTLRELVRRCASLKEQRTQEINRQKSGPASALVLASLTRSLAYLDEEIDRLAADIRHLIAADDQLRQNFELLTSIPGIGAVGAAVLMAEIPNIVEFKPKALAAFAGLSPAEHSSGQQKRSAGISRIGNATVRSTLYLGALSARRYNPALKDFAVRMKNAGKPNKVVLIAVARRLLVLAHAVLRSQKPFDPAYAQNASAVA